MEIYYDIFIGDECVALIKGLLQAYPEDYTMSITIKMTERCAALLRPREENNNIVEVAPHAED